MRAFIYYFSIIIFITVCFACDDHNEQKNLQVNVRFQYISNKTGVDEFDTEINKVNLYIFNSEGRFIDEYCLSVNELQTGNTIGLNLEPGIYDFVVWGNITDSYSLCTLEKGVTNVEDCHVSLKCSGDIVEAQPTSLFYGSAYRAEVKLSGFQGIIAINMVKNTKSIRVTTTNLDVNNLEEIPYSCSITSLTKGYKFDNTVFCDQKFTYLPQIHINNKNELVADFVVLNLSNDNSDGSRLIFTKKNQVGQSNELFNMSLTELLLPLSLQGNIEFEDSLEVELNFGDIY